MSSHRVTVCRRDELTPGGAGRFDVEGLAVAVVRIVDEVHVIGDRSTHEGVSLSEGQVDEDERLLECWKSLPESGAADVRPKGHAQDRACR